MFGRAEVDYVNFPTETCAFKFKARTTPRIKLNDVYICVNSLV